jgi:carbamate kinase
VPHAVVAISFLEGGGKQVVITDPEHIGATVAGRTGTRIVP